MRTHRPEPHTLAGAYALDALTCADRAPFERHLARCPQCAQEIRGLREATAPASRPPRPNNRPPASPSGRWPRRHGPGSYLP